MKRRILVMDDDLQSRELLKDWLELEGHEAVLAATLEEGFVGIATEPLPDVVLMDIQMGNKSGLTLVHWARRQKHLAQMPIAAVTGLSSFKDLKRIGEAGCNTCFTKPMDFRALREYLAGLGIHSVGKTSK